MVMQRIGKYEILGELGRGAMGVVHKAHDPGLDRLVALKTMFTGGTKNPEARERFLREARSAARLQHPNIITIFELGEVDDIPFIAMELLEGRNLADERKSGGLCFINEQLQVAEQLCRGLHFAHQRGVIHRDVKPTNAFILPDGTAKLLDFGIACLEGGTFATGTGVVLGTPHYMAPEHFAETPVDFRVDMWGVGVILYELFTGHRPFDAKSVPSLIYTVLNKELPAIEAEALGIPDAAVEVVGRALAKKPEDRFESMAEMGAALRRALSAVAPAAAANLEDRPSSRQTTEALHLPRAAPADAQADAEPELLTDPIPDFSAGSFQEERSFGEREGLATMAAAPDESILAVGGIDGSIRLWDLDKRMKTATLRSRPHLRSGHAARTTALAFSSDGALLASGHLDGAVYLWQLSTGFEYEAKMRHEGAVHGLVFTPDDRLLISAGADANLKYWDLPAVIAGEAMRQLRRQPAECTALAIANDGQSVISGHANRSLRVHEIASGRLIASLHGHRSAPSAIAVSSREGLLASGSRSGSILLFRVDTKAQLRTYESHGKTISAVSFLPGGKHLMSAAMDRQLMVWNLSSSEPVAVLNAHADESLAALSCLAGRRLLLGGLSDGRLRVWSYV